MSFISRPNILNQAHKLLPTRLKFTSSSWTIMIRISCSTSLLKFRSKASLRKLINLSLRRPWRLNLTEGLGLTEAETSSEQKRVKDLWGCLFIPWKLNLTEGLGLSEAGSMKHKPYCIIYRDPSLESIRKQVSQVGSKFSIFSYSLRAPRWFIPFRFYDNSVLCISSYLYTREDGEVKTWY